MKRIKPKKKVFVGLSGGVDSSVAAYLLKVQGYEVVGIHLRCWNKEGCDVREAEYARRVAEHLEIPFYIFDMEKEYKRAVVDYMIAGYKEGITPNPDVMCNKEIKFGLFLKKALEFGADFVATGHYVRLATDLRLIEAKDKSKDQSYFLWTLTQKQLKHSLFPVGNLLKTEVRVIAKKAGLPTADKKDSQGICFIGNVNVKDFLAEYLPKKKGKIVGIDGKFLGKHDGIQFYTIGQRHGLGIGGGKPYYIVSKDKKTNVIMVSEEGNKALYKSAIEVAGVSWTSAKPNQPFKALVRVRYRQPLFPARVESASKGKLKIIFDHPQKFIAEGQSAVIYSKKGEMLGGGVII